MRFSIITCTYNSAKYIIDNINSVKNQIYRDFEHVFIDGCSTDDTVNIIKTYQQKYSQRVKLFQFPPQGISDAMNKGIQVARGEYINHLHSDDRFYSNKILNDVNNFLHTKNNQPELVYGKVNFINTTTQEDRVIPHRIIYHKINFWLLLFTNYIPHQSVFLKKDVFARFGDFDTKIKYSMDYDLWLRLAKNKIKSQFINEKICNCLIRENANSFIGKFNKERFYIFNKYLKNKYIIKILFFIDQLNKKRSFLN